MGKEMKWILSDGALCLGDEAVLRNVAANFSLVNDKKGNGVFVSLRPEKKFTWTFHKLGELQGLQRFAALHVHSNDNPFWYIPCAGDSLRNLPALSSWMLAKCGESKYVMIVPLFTRLTSHTLIGGEDANTVRLFSETGDFTEFVDEGVAAFIMAGGNIWDMVRRGVASVSAFIPSAKPRTKKPLPRFAENFGWCTWNAFYRDVSQEKMLAGLRELNDGGIHPRTLILDDGWQDTTEFSSCGDTGGELKGLDANAKFPGGLKATVDMARQQFGITDFLVWHAVHGYWSGINKQAMPQYKPKLSMVNAGRFLQSVAPMIEWMAPTCFLPAKRYKKFYEDYHAHLAEAGVDGVKVDNQSSITFLGNMNGGRVQLFREMRDALNATTEKHFHSQLISCMCHSHEIFYNARTNNMARGSNDFFPDIRQSHGLHVYTNAMMGAWFGEFMWIDWDMFMSGNCTGAFHAAARAVSGSPIYIADELGRHDVELIKRLCFSDGTAPRCTQPGKPTADCIFQDVLNDPALLKVFNFTSRDTAVIGAFNANCHDEGGEGDRPAISGFVSPSDVPGLKGEHFIMWFCNSGRCEPAYKNGRLPLTLRELDAEVVSIVPQRKCGISPIGIKRLFAPYAGIAEMSEDPSSVTLKLRDSGEFIAHCKSAPAKVTIDGFAIDFKFAGSLLTVDVPADHAKGELRISTK